MLVALNDIANEYKICISQVSKKSIDFKIPSEFKREQVGYGKYKKKMCNRKYIEEKYVKYIVEYYDKEELIRLAMRYYEAKTDDWRLLVAYDNELATMWKNDLMKFCINKKLI